MASALEKLRAMRDEGKRKEVPADAPVGATGTNAPVLVEVNPNGGGAQTALRLLRENRPGAQTQASLIHLLRQGALQTPEHLIDFLTQDAAFSSITESLEDMGKDPTVRRRLRSFIHHQATIDRLSE